MERTESKLYECKKCGEKSFSPLIQYECSKCGYTSEDIDYKEAYECLKVVSEKRAENLMAWCRGENEFKEKYKKLSDFFMWTTLGLLAVVVIMTGIIGGMFF